MKGMLANLELQECDIPLAGSPHHAVEQLERRLHIPKLLCLRPKHHLSVIPYVKIIAARPDLKRIIPSSSVNASFAI